MKLKISNKEIKQRFKNIIVIGYCNAQYLLKGIEPTFYNCGVYGWNYDLYEIDYNTCIITGYRNFPKPTLEYKYIDLERYEEQAKKCYSNSFISYNDILKSIEVKRNNFIKNCYK